jgi:hypothetical protein
MSIHVEFRNIDDEVMGNVRLRDGRAVLDEQIEWVKETLVLEPDNGRPLEPSDGERYLRALPANFDGPYTHAVLIS